MSLEVQIAEILATILTATVEPEDLHPLYDDLADLCEFVDALRETVPGHNEECLCAACTLTEHEMDEAATTLVSLRNAPVEPGRPTPLPLRRCNALSAWSTETGANACEGGTVWPETPVYTPEESPNILGVEPDSYPYLTEGGDVSAPSAERS